LIIGITDGDTLTARCPVVGREQPARNLTVRLAEIDAPEKRQAYGAQSKAHLAQLCFGRRAWVHPKTRDRYGRTVARVSCDGIDASVEQARSGMAWRFVRYSNDPLIARLEADAKAGNIGLWSDAMAVAPWDWRLRSLGRPAWHRLASEFGKCHDALREILSLSATRTDLQCRPSVLSR